MSVATFIDYGLAFQRLHVPMLDETHVVSIKPSSHGFALRLEDGSSADFRRVILALGRT